MDQKKSYGVYVWLPLLLGLMAALGLWAGMWLMPGNQTPQEVKVFQGRSDKLRDVLSYILNEYVDTLNEKQLQDDAIASLLEQLDPHSSYIPASDLPAVSEQLEGNFDGIGVEFNIQKDTIMVVAAISGGPSEQLGISSGDRIIRVEGEEVAGKGIKNEDVIKRLRGKRGTQVKVDIYRPSTKQITSYTITRGQIPIYSVDASYMIDAENGYIRISRFAATTFNEYAKAFNDLKRKGMKNLILDLRDNPGGYLNAAVDICDEFLPKGQQIVYTEGKARAKEDFKASSKGNFEQGGLVVLIDEGSASASEIVSGAVQDNDRGWVIGRRSFGKGLVQEQREFKDGSALRLTIARYYTPSGRSIQKSYENGTKEYYKELLERYTNTGDELTGDTAVAQDSLSYKTLKGRTVYGGGGITPDILIPIDTSGYSKWLSESIAGGHMNRFAFEYTDRNRKQFIREFPAVQDFIKGFNKSACIMEFLIFAKQAGLRKDDAAVKKSEIRLGNQLAALVARNLYGSTGFHAVMNTRDKAVLKSIELLKSGAVPGENRELRSELSPK